LSFCHKPAQIGRMARVLYGVMGNTNGHVMRTLAIVSKLPDIEFCFVGGGRAAEVLKKKYVVHEVPVLRTKHRNQKLDLPGTIAQIAGRICDVPKVTGGLVKLIDEWQPDIAISDREFFLPLAAMRTGLPCASVDHTHLLKACRYTVPPELRFNWSLTMLNDYLLFDFTKRNWIVSFFHPRLKPGRDDEMFHPVIRQEAKRVSPCDGGDVFVYLSIPGFDGLLSALSKIDRRVVVYGSGHPPGSVGNMVFRQYDEQGIFDDLARAAYVVINGGHNLISEALFFGKPIFCFPIAGLFEQFLNAWHVKELGYGDYSYERNPSAEMFATFEGGLVDFRAKIKSGFREGTDALAERIRQTVSSAQKSGLGCWL